MKLQRLAALTLAAMMISTAAHGDVRSDAALNRSQGALGDEVPDLAFTTSDGKRLSLAQLRGKPVLINLIYTGCADVCPAIIERLAPAVDAAGDALGQDSFAVVTIGFDTRHDTPDRMGSFARSHGAGGANWYFASVDQATLDQLSTAIGFSFFPSAGGFDHMAQVSVLDKSGRIYRQIYGAAFEPPAIVEPLKELVFGREKPLFSLQGLSDRIKLFCTVYNPNTGRYYFNYSLFMSIAVGAASLLAVLLFLVREIRKHARAGEA